MARPGRCAGVVLVVLVLSGCAHTPDGARERTGLARFDAHSVTSPTVSFTKEPDGSWAGAGRYIVEDDALRAVAPFATSGFIAPGSTRVNIDRAPGVLSFIPTAGPIPSWTFVTEDGGAIPRDLEVPLYLAARIGMGGMWVTFHDPDYREDWWHLGPDCAVVLFELQGRQIAGWVQRYGGQACPQIHFPDPQIVSFLQKGRNEHWDSPLRVER